jgi:AcrR family transcriptional regulator
LSTDVSPVRVGSCGSAQTIAFTGPYPPIWAAGVSELIRLRILRITPMRPAERRSDPIVRTQMFPEGVYGREMPTTVPDRAPQRLPRGRHGLPRRFIVHNQRERMLLAVAEAVAEQGYATTTVADIIARARLSRRTFYEHFADKEECFLAAYDTVVEQMLAGIGHAYEQADGWTQKVHDGLQAFISYLVAEPAFARMCVVEVIAAGVEARGRRDAAMRTFVDFLEPGRDEAPKGIVVPTLAADIVVGGIYEIIYTRLLRNAADELVELLPELLYCALVPYIGHRAAEKAVRDTARRAAAAAAARD